MAGNGDANFADDWQRQEGFAAAQARAQRQSLVKAQIQNPLHHLKQKISARGGNAFVQLRAALVKAAPTVKTQDGTAPGESVNEEEFAKGVRRLGVEFNPAEAREAFLGLGPGADGRLNIDHAAKAMQTSANMTLQTTDHARSAAEKLAAKLDAANLQKATATTGEELRSRLAALMGASKNQNSAFNRFRRVSGSSTSAVSLPEFRVAVEALQLFATPTAVDDCFRMMVEGSSDQQITYGIFVKALFGDHGKETSLTTSDQVRAQRIKKANDRAAQLAAFASAQAAQEGGADGGILADPVFRFRERMLHRASTKSALLGEFNKLRVACHIGADVDGIPFENFTQLGLRSLGLELSAAQGAVLFKALDINKSGVVKFEDFCRLVFQSDNMVIDSHDHNKQRAADRAASLALRAAAVGRVTSGKELLDAFRRKMEGKPNISLAFNKFRRLSGSADGTLTQQQFQTAMIKSGTNATQAALDEMWSLLQTSDSHGRLDFHGFAQSVVGDHSAKATLQAATDHRRQQGIQRAKEKQKQQATAAEHAAIAKAEHNDPITDLRNRLQRKSDASVLSSYHKFRSAARGTKPVDSMQGRVNFEEFSRGIAGMGLQMGKAQVRALFSALDSTGSNHVALDDFARTLFHHDNMVLASTDHTRQQAVDKAKQLAKNAAAIGLITGGVELLRVFSEKMEMQPNTREAFTKFRRLSGSSNADITFDQFVVAMHKWGLNTSKKALREMWQILDADSSGTMSFAEFADGVVGNYSESASLGKIKAPVTVHADGTIHIDNEAVKWVITQLARAVHRNESDVRRTFARFADPKSRAANKLGVDFNGLRAVLKQLDIPVYDQQLMVLFEALDRNRDGVLDFDEFGSKFFTKANMLEYDTFQAVDAMNDKKELRSRPGPRNPTEKLERVDGKEVLKKIVGILMRNATKARREMENAFARFRKPVRGDVGLDKLSFRAAIKQMGIQIWVDEADALFSVLDVNDNGCVDATEFFDGLLRNENVIVPVYKGAKTSGAAEEYGLAAQAIGALASQDAKSLHKSLMNWLNANGSSPSDGFREFLKAAKAENVLTQPEFKRGVKLVGIKATEAATQELFALLDPNHDLCVDEAEFFDGFYSLDDQKLEKSRKWNDAGPDKRTQHARAIAEARAERLAVEANIDDTGVCVNVLKRAYEVCCGRTLPDSIEKLHEIFGRFARPHGASTRGDSLNAQEFRALLAALAAQLPRAEASAVFKRFDKNRDRFIDFGELCAGLGLPTAGLINTVRKNTQAGSHSGRGSATARSRTSPRSRVSTARLNTHRSVGSAQTARLKSHVTVSATDMKQRATLLSTPRGLGSSPATARKMRVSSRNFKPDFSPPVSGRVPEVLPQLVGAARGGAYTPRSSNVAIAAALSARRKNERRGQQQKRGAR